MKLSWILFLGLLAAGGFAGAEDKKPEKAKPAAKSDKNVFQKTESSIGDWANRNKIWVRHKKSEKAKKD
jgi:hypothetical protein